MRKNREKKDRMSERKRRFMIGRILAYASGTRSSVAVFQYSSVPVGESGGDGLARGVLMEDAAGEGLVGDT